VKQALDLYYEQVRSRRPVPAEVLKATGFIGCGEAPPDLSERYKEDVKRDRHHNTARQRLEREGCRERRVSPHF
jgi:hypothetical protein